MIKVASRRAKRIATKYLAASDRRAGQCTPGVGASADRRDKQSYDANRPRCNRGAARGPSIAFQRAFLPCGFAAGASVFFV
ncbi:MAG: hypothetical protein CTY15_14080, partial [Methylocystis sp.]